MAGESPCMGTLSYFGPLCCLCLSERLAAAPGFLSSASLANTLQYLLLISYPEEKEGFQGHTYCKCVSR